MRRIVRGYGVSLVVALALCPSALASFPGANGEITFDVYTDTTGTVEDGECATPHCEEQRIYAFRVGDRKARQLATCSARECHDSYPAWSPDGRRLAFTRRVFSKVPNSGDEPQSFLATWRWGDRAQVLSDGPSVYQPAWAPDGTRLVFSSEGFLSVANPDGSDERRLACGGSCGSPDWSFRGTIAFTRLHGRYGRDLWAMRPGGEPRRLTRLRDAIAPSWSPDGRRIAFDRYRQGGIWVISPRGDKPAKRLSRKSSSSSLAWSPDGRLIAFTRGRGIFTMRSNGSHLRRVYTTRPGQVLIHIAWRPRTTR